MSQAINEEKLELLKALICKITRYKENSEEFNVLLKKIVLHLKKSDSMYFSNKNDIDRNILSMGQKFCFHGFFKQSEQLNSAYKQYINLNLSKSEIINRLNVTKLMLLLSDSPVSKFLENPQDFEVFESENEENINWGEYLKEGIEIWNPNFNENSDISDCESSECSGIESTLKMSNYCLPVKIKISNKDVRLCFQANREELLNIIQKNWYNSDEFRMVPQSKHSQANVAISFDDFRRKKLDFLVKTPCICIITEYCVIREIIWQLFCAHSSVVFEFKGDLIFPKKNITISSVLPNTFQKYLYEFVEYINLMEYFRDIFKKIKFSNENISVTYRSYAQGVQNILEPVYSALLDIEGVVIKQETTYTLLNLAKDLKRIFEPIKLLKNINESIINFNLNSNLISSLNIIKNLHESLPYCLNKLEQDIRLTLFIRSTFHYLHLVDLWLNKNFLRDFSQEFLIIREENCELHEMNYVLQEDAEVFCENNSFLKIFCQKVLKIGRNIHFLIQLEKYDIVQSSKESITDEFYRKIIEEIGGYYKINSNENIAITNSRQSTEINCEKIDSTDGFLMLAFSDFLQENSSVENIKKADENNLFLKISSITTSLFPKNTFIERIFCNILNQRFTISGLMVKTILIDNFLLEKHLKFLRHIYLFFDDIIFPFYLKLFTKNNILFNNIALTSVFQNTVMDIYPEFFQKIYVTASENILKISDPIIILGFINIKYDISWPVNIIIRDNHVSMYRNSFEFILKLKWALYVTSHLNCKDLEHNKTTSKSLKSKNMKLKMLRFSILNILNTVQHFLFGYIFNKALIQFELDFEKANDLNSLIESHDIFIYTIYEIIECLQNEKNVFEEILNCVKLLKNMWNNSKSVREEQINECFKKYYTFYKTINTIIFM